jgi:hypothetical protein
VHGLVLRQRELAPAVAGGQPLLGDGVVVAVDDLLVVLGDGQHGARPGPTTPNDQDADTDAQAPDNRPHDWVYNSQTDQWKPCGHGLTVGAGAVAAYRGGISPRLWVLAPPDSSTADAAQGLHTLSVSQLTLFDPDYMPQPLD